MAWKAQTGGCQNPVRLNCGVIRSGQDQHIFRDQRRDLAQASGLFGADRHVVIVMQMRGDGLAGLQSGGLAIMKTHKNLRSLFRQQILFFGQLACAHGPVPKRIRPIQPLFSLTAPQPHAQGGQFFDGRQRLIVWSAHKGSFFVV